MKWCHQWCHHLRQLAMFRGASGDWRDACIAAQKSVSSLQLAGVEALAFGSASPDYESEGRKFESCRAHHLQNQGVTRESDGAETHWCHQWCHRTSVGDSPAPSRGDVAGSICRQRFMTLRESHRAIEQDCAAPSSNIRDKVDGAGREFVAGVQLPRPAGQVWCGRGRPRRDPSERAAIRRSPRPGAAGDGRRAAA